VERKHRRQQNTGRCWQKNVTLQGARQPKKEREAGRDLEKHGGDGPGLVTHCSSWQETFATLMLLSPSLPPSSSAVLAAQS